MTSSELILVTCAAGKQAAHLLPLLDKAGYPLRLAVNSIESQQKLIKLYPNAEIFIGDLCDKNFVKNLLNNITIIYYIGPPMHPHETLMGITVIEAAILESQNNRFRHFIYSSVIYSILHKLMNHDCKRFVEEYLIESSLLFTILQPTHFIDNFPIKNIKKQENPIFQAHWNPEIKFSFLYLKDLAEITLKIIKEGPKHYYASYQLASTQPMTYTELCSITSKMIKKNINIEQEKFEENYLNFLKQINGNSDGPYHPTMRDAVQRMLLYYNDRGLIVSTNVMTWLLGHEPISVENWLQHTLADE